MLEAFNHGVNYFDTAEVYASGECEKVFGQALRDLGFKRSDIVVSTKLFWGGSGPNDTGLSKKHVFEGMNASLSRLGLDYVDIVMAHRPDPLTPMEEIVRAKPSAAKGRYIVSCTLTTTMGPGIRVDASKVGARDADAATPQAAEEPVTA